MSFQQMCAAVGLPEPVAELRFAPPRKWRFDWAWLGPMIALEIEGGVWTGGRHNRSAGFLKDMEKYNEAACLGWRIVRCTPSEFNSGNVFHLLKRIMPDALSPTAVSAAD